MSVIGNAIMLSGGGNPTAEENDVTLFDYDGTIRYSYSAEEFANLTEMPANPSHDGLTAQGWNWTLSDAKAYVSENGGLEISQSYITSDSKTHIRVLITGLFRIYLGLAVNGSAIINWGDGSAAETVSGSSDSTIINTPHEYAARGAYDITVDVQSGTVTATGNTTTGSQLVWGNAQNQNGNYGYQASVAEVNVGTGFKLGDYALRSCVGLKCISMPNEIGLIGTGALSYCTGLRFCGIPSGATTNRGYCFNYATALETASLPKRAFDDRSAEFQSCAALRKIHISMGIFGTYYFYGCYALQSIVIADSVTYWGTGNFYNCYGLGLVRWVRSTPPTLSNSNAFNGVPTTCLHLVPFDSIKSYLTATNYPSPSTYTYIGYKTFTDGATLPSQDSTSSYNVTWYASRSDALAQTNAITTGNGNEIYCRYVAA